uniref:Uncharacterized protein n=1 Tax=Arundo donax TaxID=35708 RepID=A0A0A9EVI7_ARUDO
MVSELLMLSSISQVMVAVVILAQVLLPAATILKSARRTRRYRSQITALHQKLQEIVLWPPAQT